MSAGRATARLWPAIMLPMVTLAAACGSSAAPSVGSSPVESSPITSATVPPAYLSSGGVVVTVPALPGSDSPAAGTASAPAAGDPGTAGSGSGGLASQAPGPPSTAVTSVLTQGSASSASGPGQITSTGIGSEPSPSSGSGPSSTAAVDGPTATVDLTGCSGCAVVASRRAVVDGFGAALVSTSTGAALLSVRADGSRAGAINVPYGSSFPPPAGGVLACDNGARCVVVGRQPDGTAILSAFLLGPDGSWRDVSGSGGFPSATAVAAAVDLDGNGSLDLVVQEHLTDGVGWIVFAWVAGRYTVRGCSAVIGGDLPRAGDLSPTTCAS